MSDSKRFFFFFVFLFLLNYTVFSQCCSTGSPVGASVYVGVLQKNDLRVITYYRYNYSDNYYEENQKVSDDSQNLLKYSFYNFGGIGFGYGITNRLTVETAFGYFFNKTQVFNNIDYEEKGYGLSNGSLIFKYGAFVKPSKLIELTVGGGMMFPFSSTPQTIDGVQLSRDVQPSTNAFAVTGMIFFNKGFKSNTWRIFTINRYDYNFSDPSGYQYGSILLNSVFVSRKIVPYFFGILQLRNEYKTMDNDNGTERINTGNNLLILSPQLTYSIAKKWNVSALIDIPVYKYYNGKQLTPKYSFAVSLTRDFNLSGKKKAEFVNPVQQ